MRLTKIISGGQAGADRGALDAAILLGIPHGGFCPKGRRSEDGPIPAKYQLVETSSAEYPERTRLNVSSSDGTAVFMPAGAFGPGSKLTINTALAMRKPLAVLKYNNSSAAEIQRIATLLKSVIEANSIRILNVAGSRESRAPGIGDFVCNVLVLLHNDATNIP